jgi:hypothetical protein
MTWRILFEQLLDFLEIIRKAVILRHPVPELRADLQQWCTNWSATQQQAIQKKIAALHKQVSENPEQEQLIAAAIQNDADLSGLEEIKLDIEFYSAIETRIVDYLTIKNPSYTEVTQTLLDEFAQHLACQPEPKDIARKIIRIPTDNKNHIRVCLGQFKSAFTKAINAQVEQGKLPEADWGYRMWDVFCTLLLLTVNAETAKNRLRKLDGNTQLPGLEIAIGHDFILPVVSSRLSRTFPHIDIKQTITHNNEITVEKKDILANEIPIYAPPHTYGITDSTKQAMKSLLFQIYQELGSTQQIGPIEDTIQTIQQILEDKKVVDKISYYIKVEKDYFSDPTWIAALCEIDRRLSSAMLIFSVINQGAGTISGLLLIADGACQQHINDMLKQIERLHRSE